MKTTKQILIDAAELIDEKGKARSVFYDGVCFCSIGALAEAVGHHASRYETYLVFEKPEGKEAVSALRSYLGFSNLSDIYDWNDNPANSAPDIADAMRKAAEAL